MPPIELRPLIDLTRQLAAEVQEDLTGGLASHGWAELERQFAEQTGQHAVGTFAHAVAQAVVCGQHAVTMDAGQYLTPAVQQWLLDQADPLVQRILSLCFTAGPGTVESSAASATAARIALHLRELYAANRLVTAGAGGEDRHASTYFCEWLLAQYDTRSRRRQGVYYTPPRVAGYVVRAVDQVLRSEFGLPRGLADRTTWQELSSRPSTRPDEACGPAAVPFVRVLDPAMGTGVFLLEVFDHVRDSWVAARACPHASADPSADAWDEFVAHALLPRICGQDLMLPAVVLAQLLLTVRLSQSGYRFTRPARLHLFLGNTMNEPRVGDTWLAQEGYPYTVILGNPPFSGVSDHSHPWIHRLLRGRAPGNRAAASYFQVDGQPLGERKHWLDDDYVKFLRLAHWLIEHATAGVVAFVTNHGFLDNATFRGMRQQLLQTFSRVTVVDLHGNTRTGERPPQGGPDESVFGIEQGVAISLWRRPFHGSDVQQVEHAELWGRCEEKLCRLEGMQPLSTTRLTPHTPYYVLVPREQHGEAEYARGFRLSDIMPVNSTAAVTARDGLVVAFSPQELRDRLSLLCDQRVSDDEIRQRFFTSRRSSKYPPGDTRGWRLAAARERLRREADWTPYLRDCLYRPFDRRTIFWAPWMIDWPRETVMAHLAGGHNRAIVARRQVPASHPCNYFWITDTITLDGLIRSDNRGSESVFPLFLTTDETSRPLFATMRATHAEQHATSRRANFTAEFLDRVATQLALTWSPASQAAQGGQFTAEELFHYIYALLHAPSYRERFATWLRLDFPRVFIPRRATLFHHLSALGAQLATCHLLHAQSPAAVPLGDTSWPVQVHARGPRLADQYVVVNKELSLGPVATDVWEFRVGAHHVCQKWLKDRRGRDLDPADLTHYHNILASVQDTLTCMRQIDEAIAAQGDWPAAFA